MTLTLEQLKAKVAGQKTALPAFYGSVDFDATPERFNDDPIDPTATDKASAARARILADPEKVERMRAYSMLGDTVADAYAALIPQHGFRGLIDMLTRACDQGLDAVPEAPPELVAFIHAMEQTPAWLDMALVEEGARLDRNNIVNVSPFTMRAGFIATFMNKYAALPMALTGTLSNETSAKRVKETATFFATTALPGALERHGPGFRAAAMVRLMHSMVRFNALRSKGWDKAVFGIPIPQIDQMPAGLAPIFFMAYALLAKGRIAYTPQQRAKVELARYRCFLLGLPEELLPDTPQGIVEIMNLRDQTLRKGFDDKTCGELLRATLDAYLPADESLGGRMFNRIEKGFSKMLFVRVILGGDEVEARSVGVTLNTADRLFFLGSTIFVGLRRKAYDLAADVPGLREAADRTLVRKIHRLLAQYGHAEFTSDAAAYRANHLPQAA
ncbi:oxygenase MpaB family protein [Caulobacter mirabilis]|uniref:ER-bound oxygenase mpaB/mpaB'/Rubber oxygenase catalytic domain-containing protein n=1 Tax=Caulobacter mirabilis TaxID=69666 RepID=A0A2D2AW59_9CAUL|nr:oxygenase MpaB family protein [Caulobacter mirabilis]ATQ42244.1 hypothetical protein CSW64_07340 [Caulobacter mirabilis]